MHHPFLWVLALTQHFESLWLELAEGVGKENDLEIKLAFYAGASALVSALSDAKDRNEDSAVVFREIMEEIKAFLDLIAAPEDICHLRVH